MADCRTAGRVFTDRLRKSIQRDFSTIKFGGLGLGFRVRVLVVARVWVRVTSHTRIETRKDDKGDQTSDGETTWTTGGHDMTEDSTRQGNLETAC